MILATLTLIATLASTHGTTCAAIDNTTNTVAWATPSGRTTSTHYVDHGDHLGYVVTPTPDARPAVHAVERLVVRGAAGPKVRVACRR